MQRPHQPSPWIFVIFGLPALVRGWTGLLEEPPKRFALVSTASGVVLLAIAALAWWNLRRTKA